MSKTPKEIPTVPDNAIGVEDLIKDRFYQVPKVLMWNEKYRTETNSDGKLLYALIKDRFENSLDTTRKQIAKGQEYLSYVDENKKVFCIVDNQEIMFDLNLKTVTTARKVVKQLIDAGLVYVQPKNGGANHLYLLKPDSTNVSFSKYMADKYWFKHMLSRKDKKLEGPGDKTYEQILAECEEKWGPSNIIEEPSKPKKPNNNPDKPEKDKPEEDETKRGSKINPLGDTKNDPPEGAKNDPPGGEKISPPGEQNITPNKTDSSEPDSYDTDISDTEPNSFINSSSRDKTYPQDGDNPVQKELEEEEQSNQTIKFTPDTLITKESGFQELRYLQVLKDERICETKKDFNVVCNALKEAGVSSFPIRLATMQVGIHLTEVAKRLGTPDEVQYDPAFYANGLVDLVKKREKGLAQHRARKKAKQLADVQTKELPLFNWIPES